jgi:hypothetical protein
MKRRNVALCGFVVVGPLVGGPSDQRLEISTSQTFTRRETQADPPHDERSNYEEQNPSHLEGAALSGGVRESVSASLAPFRATAEHVFIPGPNTSGGQRV